MDEIVLGLKRGTVKLVSHQAVWKMLAEKTINQLWEILGDAAVDIQHIGSTAIEGICAKPIIDIVVGVRTIEEIMPYLETLKHNELVFRGQDVEEQLLFVKGDFEKEIRTHHIHVVRWNGSEWNNYVNFRDYLKAFPEKALIYDDCKQRLANQFPSNRKCYTEGKRKLIDTFLEEARQWRRKIPKR